MSALRGKQHWARVDADVRRTAAAVSEAERAERDLEAAKVRAARSAQESVGRSELAGARVVKDGRCGTWHEVVRVNRTTVTVTTEHSWTDKIPHGRIVEVRK